MRKYPKTYKGKLTKRQREIEKQKIVLAFIITFIVGFGSYLMAQAGRVPGVSAQDSTRSHTKLTDEQKDGEGSMTPERTKNETVEEYTVKEKLRIEAIQECGERDLGDYCIKDLMAMAWTESRFDPNTVGDNGNSYGLYQINLKYHPGIAKKQAQKIGFSVEWTLNRLIKNGYPKYRSYAIRRHNGGMNWRTAQYLASVDNY